MAAVPDRDLQALCAAFSAIDLDADQQHQDAQFSLNSLRSPILRLPGEIRNCICEYVLTTNGQLCFSPGRNRRKPKLIHSERLYRYQEFNRIKYVCRQLYRETAGLEAKFNTVKFSGPRPSLMFLYFIQKCSAAKASWFSSIVLIPTGTNSNTNFYIEPASSILPIADYCRKNPQLTVVYLPDGFDATLFRATHFFAIGNRISWAVRGREVEGISDPFQSVIFGRWTDGAGIERMDVPNLRFWPLNVDSLRRDRLKKRPNYDLLLKIVREWEKNGI